MISFPSRVLKPLKALRQLGPQSLALYARYQVGLRSGYYRWLTSEKGLEKAASETGTPVFSMPEFEDLKGVLHDRAVDLLEEADEIVAGKVRLFGGDPVPLELKPPGPLAHWTAYERGQQPWGAEDVKLIWEPGRFGWAYTLGRAYRFSRDERYPEAFWRFTGAFLDANPPYLGQHWASAQEVALRLLALDFGLHVFCGSPHTSQERIGRLLQAIGAHASRIPPTLVYARSQNNNHLLLEAIGLYAAGKLLPGHPQSATWKRTGRLWANRSLQDQIDEDGAYTQNSANYHRLMLQAATWAFVNGILDDKSIERLAKATRWLHALVDPLTGRAPNLGPNDGAYIFPLCACPFEDYRPVIQSASAAFLGARPFGPGPWDEMLLWFGQIAAESDEPSPVMAPAGGFQGTPNTLRPFSSGSWAYLRVARFKSRPGHADQLHLDLWWQGLNIAQDAGTYLYNAPPPWDNSLSRTECHNTVVVNGKDQMTHAGRFLWLDWAQGKVIARAMSEDNTLVRITAQHDGYRRIGVVHKRSVEYNQGWRVEDLLDAADPRLASQNSPFTARLHWLLLDCEWDLELETPGFACTLRLRTPKGPVAINVTGLPEAALSVQVVRAGRLVYGSGQASPARGWVSPTYAHKIPALSFSIEVTGPLPLRLVSSWTLG